MLDGFIESLSLRIDETISSKIIVDLMANIPSDDTASESSMMDYDWRSKLRFSVLPQLVALRDSVSQTLNVALTKILLTKLHGDDLWYGPMRATVGQLHQVTLGMTSRQ